jgi:proteasome lid subunit RPN8/RPN11
MPRRTLAIVHTHPRGESQPSARDRTEALRLAVPVLVVTTDGVIAAMPDGTVQRVE